MGLLFISIYTLNVVTVSIIQYALIEKLKKKMICLEIKYNALFIILSYFEFLIYRYYIYNNFTH